MPQIMLSPDTFRKLLRICEEELADFDTVIATLVEKRVSIGQTSPTTAIKSMAPDLTGTTLREAEVGGKRLQKVDWNAMMLEAISQAAERLQNPERLEELISIKHVSGRREGYYFVPSANLSVQGQNANAAWKSTERIAKALDLTVKARFMWGSKSENPGGMESLSINA